MKHLNNILLFSIISVALILRTFSINNIPPSLTWDEVSWGYNAWSLGLDGKDEFGKFLPTTYIESFGDFKPPLYAYLDIIPVKIFGLTEFATRLPSALFGTASVFLTYFLVKQIFGKDQRLLALISSGMLALSPWHIMLSRAAFEANVASFFTILGVLLFLVSQQKRYLLVFSMLSFVAAMYTFNSARIVVPVLVGVLFISSFRWLLKQKIYLLVAIAVSGALFLPLFLFLQTPQAKLRFEEVNIFSDVSVIRRVNQEIENDGNSQISKIIHNRRFAYATDYLRHYLDNLSPQFLFIKGDGNPKFSIQDVGQLYLWEIPFFIGGILVLFRTRRKMWWFIPVWLLVGIIPAGFARETPHALRIESSLPTFQILTGIGLLYFLSLLKNNKNIWITVLAIIISFNSFYFLYNYFFHYPSLYSSEWQYGYKESVQYISENKSKYKSIFITQKLGRPYIYYLFYTKTSPTDFRNNSDITREALGFVHVNRIQNVYFPEVVKNTGLENVLYIATPDEMPDNSKVLKEFKLLNGKTALVAYTI